jgi:hypothetical protein
LGECDYWGEVALSVTAKEAVEVLSQKFILEEGISGVSQHSQQLVVYVESPEVAARVPTTLMGLPVKTMVTGRFHALGIPEAKAGRTIVGLEASRATKWRPCAGGVSCGHYCYDSETRVLTEDGFKYFPELDEEDRVATLNPISKELEFQKPLERQAFPYEGIMLRFLQKHYDLEVTLNHYLYVKGRRWKDWQLKQPRDVFKYSLDCLEFLCKSNWQGTRIEKAEIPPVPSNNPRIRAVNGLPIRLYLQLLGWYLAEGCTKKDGHVIIDCGEQYVSEVVDLVREIGFTPWTESPKGKTTRVVFRSKHLSTYLSQFGDCRTKAVPRWAKQLSPELLNLLLVTLCKGDGHIEDRKGMREGLPSWYSTVSKTLAEDVAEIALKTGITPKIRKQAILKSFPSNDYIVSFSYKETSPRLTDAIITKEKYAGTVYCVTVPNHILLVERNGKLVFSGNSITAGTLAVRVYDATTGEKLFLSNNHVLAAVNRGRRGDPILQPGSYDGGRDPEDRLGLLERFIELKPSPETNLVDAALGKPLREEDLADEVLDVGVVTEWEDPTVGMRVAKSGRSTDYAEATIEDVNASVKVYYGAEEYYVFEDQVLTSYLAAPGDSGSLVVNTATKRAVGLLYAGSDVMTVLNKMRHVLGLLDITLAPPALVAPGWWPPLALALGLAPVGLVATAISGQELTKSGVV